MPEDTRARLKSTGEPVVILIDDGADQRLGRATSGYRLCLLPPQAPGRPTPGGWVVP